MEMAAVYKEAGGVFFLDMDGDVDKRVAPVQFNLTKGRRDANGHIDNGYDELVGFWTRTLAWRSSADPALWRSLQRVRRGCDGSSRHLPEDRADFRLFAG
jgi:hypothetical protein